jgi:hypothetical protein
MALVEGMSANRTANMNPNGEGYANVHDETRCIADGCMLWRRKAASDASGFCGLADAEGAP